MYQFQLSTPISAPPQVCFDLARSVDAHLHSASHTQERVVAGRTTGLLEPGEEITWEAKHLLLTRRLSTRITQFHPHTFFQDTMTQGPFTFFQHDHLFEPHPHGTLMTDTLKFQAPLGPLGYLAERLLLAPHLRRFLTTRALALKSLAEQSSQTTITPPT